MANVAYATVNGLVWGLIIAMIALGLSLAFGLIEIINVAHADLYMLGAVVTWYVINLSGSFWLAVAVAPLLVGALGMVMERGILRPIEDKPVITIIATFGLSLVLQQSVLLVFGGAPRRVKPPFAFDVPLFGGVYPGYRLFVAVVSVLMILALYTYLNRTKFGTWMRAVQQDREMATALGIPVSTVYMVTMGLSAAMAALGGALAAPIVFVDFRMGLDMLILTFIVVIIGGLGRLDGALVAAILIGITEGISSVYVTPTQARVISLSLMVLAVLLRPQGILAKER